MAKHVVQGYIPTPGLKEGTFDSPWLPPGGVLNFCIRSTPLRFTQKVVVGRSGYDVVHAYPSFVKAWADAALGFPTHFTLHISSLSLASSAPRTSPQQTHPVWTRHEEETATQTFNN